MPGVWKEIDDAGRGGYCWNCHEWKSSSRVFQIWEGVGIDERDEYEDGICPECGEKLDDDYHCRVCGESDGLLEYTPYGENMPRLYCPWCLVETAYGDFLKKLEPILTHYPGDNDPMCENFQEVKDYVEMVLSGEYVLYCKIMEIIKYDKLQREIKKFLKEYLTEKQIVSKPIIYDDRIIEEIYVDNVLIIINIIIGEFMSNIILDAYYGSNSELYENQSTTIHLHNIPNEDMQSDNIIKAFKEIYPKFEKMVKYYKTMLEV